MAANPAPATTVTVSTQPVPPSNMTPVTTVTVADPELAKAIVKVPGMTAERLAEGNKIYIQDCTRCHGMKEPSNFTSAQWEPILLRMFVKAKLTDEHEKAIITDYVMAKSK